MSTTRPQSVRPRSPAEWPRLSRVVHARQTILALTAAVACALTLSGCYTQLEHSKPDVVYTEEEAPPAADPHEELGDIEPPPLRVSTPEPTYWLSHGHVLVIPIVVENLGQEPAIIEGTGGVFDIYLEERAGASWQFVAVFRNSDPLWLDGTPPPSIGAGAVVTRALEFSRSGRFRAGVKQLSGDSRYDLLVFSEPFDVWR